MSTEVLRKPATAALPTPRRMVRISSVAFDGPIVLGIGRRESEAGATVLALALAREHGARLQLVPVVQPRPELADDSRLLERAAAVHASLIVVGLRDRRTPPAAVVDQMALRIARRSAVPLFAVLSTATGMPDAVVAAIDSAGANPELIRLAAAMLAPGGTLFLAHVEPDFTTALPRVCGLEREYRAAVKSALARAAREVSRAEVRVEVAILDGAAEQAIPEFAAKVGADTIAAVHDPQDLSGHCEMQLARTLLRRRSHSVLVVPAGCASTGLTVRPTAGTIAI